MSEFTMKYEQKNMPFRRLGSSGLRVPVFSIGGWLTIGGTVNGDPVKDIIKTAFENGINMFDEAEGYASGNSEKELGRVIKELGLRRTDIIVTTKLFWGPGQGPNDMGLSRKHIIEGARASLKRLQMDYVDVIFAHRPDHTTPMVETVRAFDWLINQGLAFYWATSEWSAREIEEAHHVADQYGLHTPIAEQCQHHLLSRERPEGEYAPLYKKYNMGTTVFSALASGMLTGKYNNGIPEDSRYKTNEDDDNYKGKEQYLKSPEGQREIQIVKDLTVIAETDLGCTVGQLALAWVARNPNTSTVILGATSPAQVLDNLKAIDVIPKLTPEILEKIENIVKNKPKPPPTFGRPSLDPMGRQ